MLQDVPGPQLTGQERTASPSWIISVRSIVSSSHQKTRDAPYQLIYFKHLY